MIIKPSDQDDIHICAEEGCSGTAEIIGLRVGDDDGIFQCPDCGQIEGKTEYISETELDRRIAE